MNETLEQFAARLHMELGPNGTVLVPRTQHPSSDDVTRIRSNKPALVDILTVAKAAKAAAEEAKSQARRAAKQATAEAIRSGDQLIRVSYQEGEYLTGYAVYGVAAALLEELGLARYVTDWGYLVSAVVVEALGEAFTYEAAVEYCRPAQEAKEAAAAEAEQAVAEKFVAAKTTGRPVLLESHTVDCDGSEEECSLDRIAVYAMPDGTRRTSRIHTH